MAYRIVTLLILAAMMALLLAHGNGIEISHPGRIPYVAPAQD